MTTLVWLLGLVIGAVGLLGAVRPDRMLNLVSRFWRTAGGLYWAVGLRLVFGIVLIVAAPDCRFPTLLRALGILSLLSALGLPLLGFARIRAFVAWWVARPPFFVRMGSLVAAGFGVLLVTAAI